MPPYNKTTSGTLYFMNSSGEYEKMGDFSDADFTVTAEVDDSVFSRDFFRNKDCELSFTMQPLNKSFMKLLFGSNNWRRLRGLPMIPYNKLNKYRKRG